MGKALMKWTSEIDAYLKKISNTGVSFAQAAEVISVKFKVVATRNSVAGRANRLGIEFTGKKLKKDKEPIPETKKVLKPLKPVFHSDPFNAIPLTDEQKYEGRKKFLNPDAKCLRFMELRVKHCRFPIGDTRDDTLRFCGADVKPGRSTPYCEYCYPLVYNAPSAKDRRLLKSLEKQK